ncbi:hypothetical protein CANARDRAFT_25471 [[Candida] arabinofermentans NRRL YB-2248]|uniref:SPX domain-containing protein n=1 Tax=[Candida] arabinofermentans NRRL YB-2248 TaxID=983967 RepID=A0A1E4SU07_9ASCO|nr:hypothetical protein CANARDRAFT_25471 [[Candida] arabinofermentans NRRL YB-2248]
MPTCMYGMKFGSELNDRSISQWRMYNIDYNDLKLKIKLATKKHTKSSISSSSSNETDSTLNSSSLTTDESSIYHEGIQKKLLKQLYKSFKKQIEFVSLFVNSKYGEISRRIMTTKKQLNILINDSNGGGNGLKIDGINVNPVQLRMRLRKAGNIQKELESLSRELQNLSRFILLQKIAVRKLFKKFIKYSDYPYKQELVDKITNVCLNGNPDSFVNLYLNDAALELTLMFDVISNFITSSTTEPTEPTSEQPIRERQESVVTLDSLKFSNEYNSITSNKFIYSKSTTFDLLSHKKGPIVQRFWIHDDNLDEIRFLLLSEFKLISDDTGLVDEDEQRNEIQKLNSSKDTLNPPYHLKATGSSVDLQQLQLQQQQQEQQQEEQDDNTFKPHSTIISLWLNNLDDPMVTSTKGILSKSSMDETLSGDTVGMIISNIDNKNPLLIAPIGGLRQFSTTNLNENLIKKLFYDTNNNNNKNKKEKMINEWQKTNESIINGGNFKMAQLSLNWCIDKKVEPLIKLKFDRLRFINLSSKDKKIDCYISLDCNIRSTKFKRGDDFDDDDVKKSFFKWNNFDDLQSLKFPHSILEIRYDSPINQLPLKIQSLIESHLVFKVDHLQFSINNYLLIKYYSNCLSDSLMLNYIVPWFDDFQNKDIRKLPSLVRDDDRISIASKVSKNRLRNTGGASGGGGGGGGILLNKDDAILNLNERKGYWNEFDDGSDYENEQGFYIDSEEGDDDYYYHSSSYNDRRQNSTNSYSLGHWFGLLTPQRIDWIMNLSSTITSKLFGSSVENGNGIDEEQSLLRNDLHSGSETDDVSDHNYLITNGRSKKNKLGKDYFDYGSNQTTSGGNGERRLSLIERVAKNGGNNSPRIDNSKLISKYNHDKILTFIYMIITLLSFLTMGIGLGIFISLLSSSSINNPSNEKPSNLIVVLIIGFICLALSLLSSLISVCLFN